MIALCGQPTKPDVEGPFFREGAPRRTNFNPQNEAGDKLVVTGTIRSAVDCSPIAGAEIDVWAATPPGADGTGIYDNDSPDFKFRGKLKSDCKGQYTYETLLPGPYPIRPGGELRPKHVHYKVTPPGGETLTTQMYFVGDPYNHLDPFFDPSLAMELKQTGPNAYETTFDITLMTAPQTQRYEVKAA